MTLVQKLNPVFGQCIAFADRATPPRAESFQMLGYSERTQGRVIQFSTRLTTDEARPEALTMGFTSKPGRACALRIDQPRRHTVLGNFALTRLRAAGYEVEAQDMRRDIVLRRGERHLYLKVWSSAETSFLSLAAAPY